MHAAAQQTGQQGAHANNLQVLCIYCILQVGNKKYIQDALNAFGALNTLDALDAPILGKQASSFLPIQLTTWLVPNSPASQKAISGRALLSLACIATTAYGDQPVQCIVKQSRQTNKL